MRQHTATMHRTKLRVLLARYQERHPAEDVRRFRRFVARQPRCFQRDCFDDGHVTASAAVLNPAGTRLLLTRHAKLGRWLQLGGHADGDGEPLRVACREAAEESGLRVAPAQCEPVDVDIHYIPPHGADPAHWHYDVRFVLRVEDDPPRFTVSDESLALAWVPLDEVGAYTSEASLLRLAAKARALASPRRQDDPR